MSNLRVYYDCNSYPTYYETVKCSRWDEDNWGAIVEFTCGYGSRDNIFSNIVPSAYRELYNILGTPKFIDSTWTSGNTLILEPHYFKTVDETKY